MFLWSDPIVFRPVTVLPGHLHDDFLCFRFLDSRLETICLVGELTEESDQFHFQCVVSLDNLEGSVGLMLTKTSVLLLP